MQHAHLPIARKYICVIGVLFGLAVHATTPLRAAEKRVSALVDGTVIETANVVGTVDVRVKSLGPSACAVKISVPGKTISVQAVPGAWSNWQELFAHMGPVKEKVRMRESCNTKVVAHIRFYPQD